MIAIVFQLFRKIQDLFALRIDMKLTINNPAFVRAVLDRVPDIAIARNDAVSLSFQLRGCIVEFIPAWSNFSFDGGWIICSKNILRNGAAIDKGAASRLIAEGF
ncbi:hypothetical protein D3C85_1575700 [compost metagenome]